MTINTVFSTASLRSFALAAAAMAVASLAPVPLRAEGMPIRVAIPFAFTLANKAMPAGEYTIVPLAGSAAISLRNVEASATMMALSLPGTKTADTPTVTFTEVDGANALTLVRAPDWTMSFAPPAPLVKPLAKRLTQLPGVAALAAAK